MNEKTLIEIETASNITAYKWGNHYVHIDDGIAGKYNVFYDDKRIGTIDIENFQATQNIPQSCYDDYVNDNPQDENIVCVNLLWTQDCLSDSVIEEIQEELHMEVQRLVELYEENLV